jgi:hypothetical protein
MIGMMLIRRFESVKVADIMVEGYFKPSNTMRTIRSLLGYMYDSFLRGVHSFSGVVCKFRLILCFDQNID